MRITLDELKAKLLEESLKALFQQAYEQGIQDAKERYDLPHVLTREHLKQVFQIEMPTVDKLTKIQTFPRFKHIQARYPRDLVFRWIEENSEWVSDNTNYYKQAIS